MARELKVKVLRILVVDPRRAFGRCVTRFDTTEV